MKRQMPLQLYSADHRIIHNQAACEITGDVVRVITPAEQWAYALEFPLIDSTAVPNKRSILKLRTRVYEGTVGIGLLSAEGTEYIRESQITAGKDSEIFELALPDGVVPGSLVVRNVSDKGSSIADVKILGCFEAPIPAPGKVGASAGQLYSAAYRVIHNQAVCEASTNTVHVTTPAALWSYAVEFPPQDKTAVPKNRGVLKIRAHVHKGNIGFGLLSARGTQFIQESSATASEHSKIIQLILPDTAVLGSLIIRNRSTNGSTTADVEILGCFEAPSDPTPETILVDPAIFTPFKRWSGQVPKGFFADWTGILTRSDVWNFADGLEQVGVDRNEIPALPVATEHVLDWVPLVQAVKESAATFRMAALGAGWGRWLAAGAALAQQLGRDYRLLGVEAEPQHYEWMLRHFVENNIPESRFTALHAAAAGKPGDCWFAAGNAREWYGQSITSETSALPPGVELRRVKCVTIDDVLDLLSPVDYLHMDIQGAETDVLSYRPERLDREVRLVNIGTHSSEIEDELRKLFRDLGWRCIYNVELGSKHPIRFGDTVTPAIAFGDGVQVWQNPRR